MWVGYHPRSRPASSPPPSGVGIGHQVGADAVGFAWGLVCVGGVPFFYGPGLTDAEADD